MALAVLGTFQGFSGSTALGLELAHTPGMGSQNLLQTPGPDRHRLRLTRGADI